MSKFMLTVGHKQVADQVSNLINLGGQLLFRMTAQSILQNPVRYIVEMDGESVIGVVGLEQLRPQVIEIKHLCVKPEYRGRGIGRRLLERAISVSNTEFVFGLVRSDNKVNIRNNLRVGMVPVGKKRSNRNYNIICFARRRDVGSRINHRTA